MERLKSQEEPFESPLVLYTSTTNGYILKGVAKIVVLGKSISRLKRASNDTRCDRNSLGCVVWYKMSISFANAVHLSGFVRVQL